MNQILQELVEEILGPDVIGFIEKLSTLSESYTCTLVPDDNKYLFRECTDKWFSSHFVSRCPGTIIIHYTRNGRFIGIVTREKYYIWFPVLTGNNLIEKLLFIATHINDILEKSTKTQGCVHILGIPKEE